MSKHPAKCRPMALPGLVICALAFFHSPQESPPLSVRAELIRLQDETGLTLAWVDNRTLSRSVWRHTRVDGGVQAVSFRRRTIVQLEGALPSFRLDGFSFDDIPRVATVDLCWSHDGAKLAATFLHPPGANLGIHDLRSKVTKTIEVLPEQTMHFTSQCWSPDDTQVAYDNGGSVKVWRVDGDALSAQVLAKGKDVTWSPDGSWIGFRDRDTYYAIHPDGSGRKKLFHNNWGRAVSALYWSRDSRIVAYVRELGFLQGGALDAEVNQLRVRRLEDGSEDHLCPDSVDWYADYQWITTRELMKRSVSASPH